MWKSVTESLPSPFEVVWAYWRDREVLLACRTYQGEEAIKCEASEGWYSFDDEKGGWINWWMSVADGLEKPKAPKLEWVLLSELNRNER